MLSTYKEGVERASTRLPILRHNPVWPQTNAAEFQISAFLCLALRTSLGYFSWFCSTKAKLLYIYRCTKSQAGFNVYVVKHTGFTFMARLTSLARITRLTGFTRFTGRTRNPRLTSPRQPHLFAKNDDALLPTLPCKRASRFAVVCAMFSFVAHVASGFVRYMQAVYPLGGLGLGHVTSGFARYMQAVYPLGGLDLVHVASGFVRYMQAVYPLGGLGLGHVASGFARYMQAVYPLGGLGLGHVASGFVRYI